MEQVIPWQAILNSPGSAWAIAFLILLVCVMRQNEKREERLMGIVDGSLKDHGNTIAKQTSTLETINTSLNCLNNAVCKTEERLDDIEDYLQINKVVEK